MSPLTDTQRRDLTLLVERARSICGFAFAVYLGPLADGRTSALEQHAALPDAASAVLVAVDPAARAIEIVTGANTTATIDARTCELAVLAMKSCFVNDDLAGGVRAGVNLLAQHARHPRTLNLDDPA
jgi:hypothetical protein